MTGTQGAPAVAKGIVKMVGTTNPRSVLVQPRSSMGGATGAHNRYTVTPAQLSSVGVDAQMIEPAATAAAGGWTGGRLSVASHSGGSGGGARQLRWSGGQVAGPQHSGLAMAAAAAGEATILLQSPVTHLSPARAAAAGVAAAGPGPNTRLRRRHTSDASPSPEAAAISDATAAARDRHSNSVIHSTTSLTVLVHMDSMHAPNTDRAAAAAAAAASEGATRTATADGQLLLPSPSPSPSSSPIGTTASQVAAAAVLGCSSPSAASVSASPPPLSVPRSSPRVSPLPSPTRAPVLSKRLTLPAPAFASLPPAALALRVSPSPGTEESSPASPAQWLASHPDTRIGYLGPEADEAVEAFDQPLQQVSEGNELNASSAGSHSDKQSARHSVK